MEKRLWGPVVKGRERGLELWRWQIQFCVLYGVGEPSPKPSHESTSELSPKPSHESTSEPSPKPSHESTSEPSPF